MATVMIGNPTKADEQSLSAILNSLGDGVIVTDTDGNITFVNNVAERLIGCKQVEVLGTPLIHIFDEATTSLLKKTWTDLLGQAEMMPPTSTFPIQTNSPTPILQGSLTPLKDDQGLTSGTVFTLRTNSDETQASLLDQENIRLFEAERNARKQAEILREEARQNLTQTTRLYELSTEFVSTLSVEETMHLVTEKIVQATKSHSAVIHLIDEAGNLSLTTAPDEPAPRSSGTTMAIIQSGQPLAINDINHEPKILHPDLQLKGLGTSIGLPLKAGENVIGALFVRHGQPRQFSWREIETLLIFANQAACSHPKCPSL